MGRFQNLFGQSSWDKERSRDRQVSAGAWFLLDIPWSCLLLSLSMAGSSGDSFQGMPGNLAGAELSQKLSLVQVLTQIFFELVGKSS